MTKSGIVQQIISHLWALFMNYKKKKPHVGTLSSCHVLSANQPFVGFSWYSMEKLRRICRESMRFVKIGPVESTLHKGVNKFLTELPMSLDRFGMKFHLVDLHLMPFSSYDFNENG